MFLLSHCKSTFTTICHLMFSKLSARRNRKFPTLAC